MQNENERINLTLPGTFAPVNKRALIVPRSEWLVTAGLIALSFIPVAAGAARLGSLAVGAAVTTENARFFAMPLPVIIHIIGASLFCILGAFQFAPGLRRSRPGWHRAVGRILVPSGIGAALLGLWMTQFYPLRPQFQGDFLYVFRLVIGSVMVFAIAYSFVCILRRDVPRHRAWMMRGYAIGQGAGTQAVVSILWLVLLGTPNDTVRDLLLIAGWIINLAVAEWIIRRNRSKVQTLQPRVRTGVPVPQQTG